MSEVTETTKTEEQVRAHKIQLINAYQKLLLAKKLPLGKFGKEVSDEIHESFMGWVRTELEVLLGEKGAEQDRGDGPFTEAQTEVLRQFAEKLINRVEGKTAPAQVSPSRPTGTALSETERARLEREARPLKESRQLLKKEPDPYLAHLEAMENDPRFIP